MSAMTALVLVLAAYRLTTFITTDKVTRPLRQRIARRFPPSTEPLPGYPEHPGPERPHPVVVLINCGRCLGFWMSGFVVGAARACNTDLGGTPMVFVWWAVAGAVTLLVTLAP